MIKIHYRIDKQEKILASATNGVKKNSSPNEYSLDIEKRYIEGLRTLDGYLFINNLDNVIDFVSFIYTNLQITSFKLISKYNFHKILFDINIYDKKYLNTYVRQRLTNPYYQQFMQTFNSRTAYNKNILQNFNSNSRKNFMYMQKFLKISSSILLHILMYQLLCTITDKQYQRNMEIFRGSQLEQRTYDAESMRAGVHVSDTFTVKISLY